MGAATSLFFIDPMTLPAGFAGDVQLITLITGSVFILCKASGWVGEGSELLLLIPSCVWDRWISCTTTYCYGSATGCRSGRQVLLLLLGEGTTR